MSELEAYERRFRRAGLPLFIEGYSAREDIWTRAAPLLALVFLGETLGATQLDWPLAANVADRLGGFEDPFGHRWDVATHVEDVPPDEMSKRMEAAQAG